MITEVRFRIYEFAEHGDQSVIRKWLDAESISKRDRGQLMAKMDLLAKEGLALASVGGPIRSKRKRIQSHTYKLIVHGDKMLRPMFCKGPIDTENEFTFLVGAIEANWTLDTDVADAEERRARLIVDPTLRIQNGRYR